MPNDYPKGVHNKLMVVEKKYNMQLCIRRYSLNTMVTWCCDIHRIMKLRS